MLIDFLRFSLGVEVWDTGFIPVLKRWTCIPNRKTKLFTTSIDNQTSVKIRILEGNRSMADDNIEYGSFELAGIGPQPWGMARIAVTFDISPDYKLIVSAKDLDSGREQSLPFWIGNPIDKYKDLTDKTEAYMANEWEEIWPDFSRGTAIFLYFTESVLHESNHRFDPEKITTIQLRISEPQEMINQLPESMDALETKEKHLVIKRKRKQLEIELFQLSPAIFKQIEFKYYKNGPGESVIYGLPPVKPRLMLPVFEADCGGIQK